MVSQRVSAIDKHDPKGIVYDFQPFFFNWYLPTRPLQMTIINRFD